LSLSPGSRIGPYGVIAQIGVGGICPSRPMNDGRLCHEPRVWRCGRPESLHYRLYPSVHDSRKDARSFVRMRRPSEYSLKTGA